MSQSLASIVVHVIFSTKGRQPVLKQGVRAELYPYMATIAQNVSSSVYEIGGIEDHVHMLFSLPRTLTLAKIVELIKKDSSKWVKARFPNLRSFAWQAGYGAFSVSASKIVTVRRYIQQQEEHHKTAQFKDELILFLSNAQLPYDEKYLWD